MTFTEFLKLLTQEQVDAWWNTIVTVDTIEKVEDRGWKYKLSKNGKSFAFKWALKELAVYYDIDLDLKDFNSNDVTRNKFCDAFDFEIEEELVYVKAESNSFIAFYTSLKQTQNVFQDAIDYLNKIVLSNEINHYKIRMAMRNADSQMMVVIGMRAVLAFREINGKARIALIIDEGVFASYKESLNIIEVERFKGSKDSKLLVSIDVSNWHEIPKEILESNTVEIVNEYNKVKDTKRATWNIDAKTTNGVFKYLIFKGEKIEQWVENNKPISYWIFQGNPKYYDVIGSLQNNHLQTWKVAAHKDKIKINDKIILWLSGENSGCYALAKVISEVGKIQNNADEISYYKSDYNENEDRVRIEIEYNLYNKPILSESIKQEESLLNFKGGNQGTNFISSKEEYDTILKLVSKIKNIKLEFIGWMIANDEGRFYFSKQFGSNRDNFQKEIDTYETIYKENFNTDLFEIDSTLPEKNIASIRTNIYDKNNGFYEYSKNRASGRPMAILGKNNYLKFLKGYFANEDNLSSGETIKKDKKMALNQILYGPPGTGKTYNTINKSLEIVGLNTIGQARKDIKKSFDERVASKQIVFTTFHQSMSYEDFIEGIKPKTKNENVTYSVEDGVFKTLVKRALTAYIRKEADIDETNSFDALYNDFVKSIKSFEGKRQGTFKSKTGVDIMLVEANDTSILVKYVWSNNKKDTEGQHTFSVTKEKLKKVLLEGLDPTKIKSLKAELHPLIGHIHCELFAIYKSFYDFVITNKGEIESIHFDYEELSFAEVKEQFDLLSKEEINAKKVDPFIIIIDEINRGNVSQIFGELITLIEEDKRLGNDESLEVVLPYSNDKFGVPPNVFIIGTMNTADRSVEALDTALRRRFSFTEIMPVLKVVEDKNFSDYPRKDIMEKINNRIEILLDRNYTLGHAYFIKKDFENSFENEIIPLLQEYFYNDFGKIGLVLGKGFMREKAITQSNNKSVFADFETKNDVDIVKNYELIPFNEVKFEDAIATLLV
jgi:hypothetical protein